MNRDIKSIIAEMTLEEKAGLCSGLDFWHTKGVERLGIPSIMMADGPHGLRKQIEGSDHLGVNASVPATCFPTGAALACSWDRELIGDVGKALGEECQKEKVSILLGPAANIKRSPLCGRNFEYLSEDPYLSSELAEAHINGVQSQGVGTSLKHYAANNQETRRLLIDAVIDERSLREIYLASFEGAVKKARPWTVMCSYNKVNGDYSSESKTLLTDILKEEWGHEGIVVSDWGAVNNRPEGLAAGLELEMPSSGGSGDNKIVQAVRNGKLSEGVLDQAVERLLKLIFKAADSQKPDAYFSMEEHHQLARRVAGECAVLLKNEDHLLPLTGKGSVAVIGAFSKHPRYQGGGSSHVNPSKLDNAYDQMLSAAGRDVNVFYAEGYKLDEYRGMFSSKPFQSNSDIADPILIQEAVDAAKKAEVAVVFAGLPENYESEGFDRKHMRIPEGHIQLIEAVAAAQKNTVVVLSNGAPVEMPWIGEVKAVLEMYLGGQASGGAVADILFGKVNPSGKLAETFPKKLKDNPSYLNFPGELEKVEYREGLYVGYRYYDAAEVEPLFPFGHGLSYTAFEYTSISLNKSEIKDNETILVHVRVKNAGKVTGKETVQLYVTDAESSVLRPAKELKGFEKVELKPGEEKTVTFTLGKRAFAFYSPELKDWLVESGEFKISVGGSSRDTVLETVVYVNSTQPDRKVFTRNSPVSDIMAVPEGAAYLIPLFKAASGENSAIGSQDGGTDVKAVDKTDPAMDAMLLEMPLRSILMFDTKAMTEEMLEGLLKRLNERES